MPPEQGGGYTPLPNEKEKARNWAKTQAKLKEKEKRDAKLMGIVQGSATRAVASGRPRRRVYSSCCGIEIARMQEELKN
jgi:hypothetical protein